MTKLEEIFANKRVEVDAAKRQVSVGELQDQIEAQSPPRGFLAALQTATAKVSLIAEIKKGSPSAGIIRPDFDPEELARSYFSAGAHCLSVLTDEYFFGGSPHNLALARRAVPIPLLRKDFINDPYQVLQARAWGADAILLIVASLEKNQIHDLSKIAKEMGMDVLVETHNESELGTASELECDLIGINNRDLSTFKVDLSTAERLIPLVKHACTVVAESAMETRQDIARMEKAGARSVLIGTAFCASKNVESKVREVMGW